MGHHAYCQSWLTSYFRCCDQGSVTRADIEGLGRSFSISVQYEEGSICLDLYAELR
jgi:hypothetical protein